MRRNRLLFLSPLLVLALLATAGCGSHEPVEVKPAQVKKELLDKTWYCREMAARDVRGDTPLTLRFNADGTVTGNGGCNDFSGSYTLDGEELRIGTLTHAEKDCGPAAGEQEFTYFSFLSRVNRLKVNGDELELYMEDQPTPLTFSSSETGGFSLW